MKSFKWTLCFIAALMSSVSFAVSPGQNLLPLALRNNLKALEALTFQQRMFLTRDMDMRGGAGERLREIRAAYQDGQLVRGYPTAVEYAVMLALIVVTCLTAVQSIIPNLPAVNDFNLNEEGSQHRFNRELTKALNEQSQQLATILNNNTLNISTTNQQFFGEISSQSVDNLWTRTQIGEEGVTNLGGRRTHPNRTGTAQSPASRGGHDSQFDTNSSTANTRGGSNTTSLGGTGGENVYRGTATNTITAQSPASRGRHDSQFDTNSSTFGSVTWSAKNRQRLEVALTTLNRISPSAAATVAVYIKQVGGQLSTVENEVIKRDEQEKANYMSALSGNISANEPPNFSAKRRALIDAERAFSNSIKRDRIILQNFQTTVSNSLVGEIDALRSQLSRASGLKESLQRLSTGLRITR